MADFLAQLGTNPEAIQALRLDMLGQLLLATVLGGLVGLERELSGKPAGLRTNLLICVGATLLTTLSIDVATAANVVNADAGSLFRSDPGRIAAQIVSGIGFLGAGTILVARGEIVGLTTAATIWVVAAIGMAVGADSYVPAIGTTVLVVVVLMLLGRWETYINRQRRVEHYLVEIEQSPDLLEFVEGAFTGGGLRARTESVSKKEGALEIGLEVRGPLTRHREVLRSLIRREGVRKVRNYM